MKKPLSRYVTRVAVLQALTVLALLLPLAGVGYYVSAGHLAAQQWVADLEPRYARLLGMLEKEPDLKAMADHVSGRLNALAYGSGQDLTKAGNDAQQRIRGLFADNGMEVGSVQVLPQPKEEANGQTNKFDRIRVEIRVEGDMSGIQNALTALASQAPAIHLETMAIQTVGAVKPASNQRLAAQFTFVVLRVRE